MGQVREEVESKILEKYREKGTITEDEIVDICLDYDLNLIEIDSICERIFSKKVIVSDDYQRKNTNDEKEYADHSHTDSFMEVLCREDLDCTNLSRMCNMSSTTCTEIRSGKTHKTHLTGKFLFASV